MESHKFWWIELWFILALLGVAAVFGFFFGGFAWWLITGVCLYLGWHLHQLRQLWRWLRQAQQQEPPDAEGIWHDIYHQLYTLQKRRQKNKRRLINIINQFKTSTDALPDGTIVTTDDGHILWFNKAAQALLGLQYRDVGQRLANLLRHPLYLEHEKQHDEHQVIEIPSPLNHLYTLSIQRTSYGHHQRLVVVRDITRLKQLEQSQKDFIANVSHELRTPITVLMGYLEMLSEQPQLPNAMQAALQHMNLQTKHMHRLVSDLLFLSQIDDVRLAKPTDVVPVISLLQDITQQARILSHDQHTIELQADPKLALLGSQQELHSAFMNMVSNAIRYTPAGGRIEIHWVQDAEGVHFIVKDNGIGIGAEHIPRLTERFYRVDAGRSKNTGGTGLGLAIVKQVLDRHQGALHIESEVDKGSVFRCSFGQDRVVVLP